MEEQAWMEAALSAITYALCSDGLRPPDCHCFSIIMLRIGREKGPILDAWIYGGSEMLQWKKLNNPGFAARG
jgi:hypothetical protein